jgi:hypothetical protein
MHVAVSLIKISNSALKAAKAAPLMVFKFSVANNQYQILQISQLLSWQVDIRGCLSRITELTAQLPRLNTD